MKWQALARQILERSLSGGLLSSVKVERIREAIVTSDGINTYRLMRDAHPADRTWNKVWSGAQRYGWYGPVVTTSSLRLAALTFADDAIRETTRHLLNCLAQGTLSSLETELLRNSLAWAGIACPADLRPGMLSKSALALLRRLNLDCRECPIIERWHWAGTMGVGYLSDGGRVYASRELVWAVALETRLNHQGRLPPDIVTFLAGVRPEHRHLPMEPERLGSAVDVLIRMGLAQLEVDGLRLAIDAGEFPRLAARLWSGR
ncbi:MAG: hypothetical protein FJY67_02680 [Calditrichaeota bacterium]|nr:hypothetical protein [Calditrichota bacterium]